MTRNTRQRRVIRDVLAEAARPLATEEILAAAQARVAGLGIATVYRTVRVLVDEGWLEVVGLPGSAPRYEVAGKGHHHHFHCRQCGRLFEIEGCLENLKRLVPAGFQVTDHDVLLTGSCAACGE